VSCYRSVTFTYQIASPLASHSVKRVPSPGAPSFCHALVPAGAAPRIRRLLPGLEQHAAAKRCLRLPRAAQGLGRRGERCCARVATVALPQAPCLPTRRPHLATRPRDISSLRLAAFATPLQTPLRACAGHLAETMSAALHPRAACALPTVSAHSRSFGILAVSLHPRAWAARPQATFSSARGTSSSSSPPADAPFIDTVIYDREFANTVYLMGNLGQDPDFRKFENTSTLATFSMAVKTGRKGDTAWYDVETWGPLAELVRAEVGKGCLVCVKGSLKTSSWVDRTTGLKRSKVVILASQISKVVYNPSGGEGWTGDAQADTGALAYEAVEGPGVAYGGYGGVQEGARAWTGTGASAERGAPAERGSGAARPAAQSEASSGARGSSKPASRGDAYVPREPLWMDLFAEGSQDRWMDFRADKAAGKRSPKFPDFKRKGDDAPLWISSRDTPSWVREALGPNGDRELSPPEAF